MKQICLEIDNIFESDISIIGLILDFLSQNINKTELTLILSNNNLSKKGGLEFLNKVPTKI